MDGINCARVGAQDEWGYRVKDDEIPCRRMRSSSYVKAMGMRRAESDSPAPRHASEVGAPDACQGHHQTQERLDSSECTTHSI
ncbi:disks large-associated protein 2-like isoform X2 [Lates japonicus]|uniref:Disks large-associated protein 2-like isoform X2 n=1 Tax=Lates japonicus TaxID=270547 RepID=A0AAD3M1J2_LATJO|nr:disks large-associated protein 2-like isoform X2 [Lates japonicus]